MVRILFAFIFILSLNLYAQNISASGSTDTSAYLVGDYIYLKIKVIFNEGIKVSNPLIENTFKGIEIIKIPDPVLSQENGNRVVEYNYIISAYDSMDVLIPGIQIGYRTGNDTTLQTVTTNPINFNVRTVPVQPGEIKDVKDPIKIPFDWKMILLFLLIALAVIGLAYFLYRRYKKKLESRKGIKVITPAIPSYLSALNSLHQLEEEELWQKGKVKEYHSRITEIIRKYFEDRFYLPALELTTSEAMGRLSSRYDTMEILQTTEEFLTNADLVKFAKFNPVPVLNKEMMKQAYHIVEKTIPKESSREVVINVG